MGSISIPINEKSLWLSFPILFSSDFEQSYLNNLKGLELHSLPRAAPTNHTQLVDENDRSLLPHSSEGHKYKVRRQQGKSQEANPSLPFAVSGGMSALAWNAALQSLPGPPTRRSPLWVPNHPLPSKLPAVGLRVHSKSQMISFLITSATIPLLYSHIYKYKGCKLDISFWGTPFFPLRSVLSFSKFWNTLCKFGIIYSFQVFGKIWQQKLFGAGLFLCGKILKY